MGAIYLNIEYSPIIHLTAMNKAELRSDYSTPKQKIGRKSSVSSRQTRYINSRKLEFVPGFDLGTPSYLETAENCPLYKQLINNKAHEFNGYMHTNNTVFAPDQYFLNGNACRSEYGHLPTQADRILDAPEIVDDYYLNLLSWSEGNNLAVALKNKLYLWNGNDGSVNQLLEYPDEVITSVAWMRGGTCLAVGDSSHTIKLFDIPKYSEIRSLSVHSDRVSSLAWNNYVLTSGSRDSTILQHDMRVHSYFVKLLSHKQEICGLKWNDNQTHLASGGNDNKICIWELGNLAPTYELKDHKAAVKALAWCPWKTQVLASGGGSSDKTIKLWDVNEGKCLESVDSGSQVSALEWNSFGKELLSAHGYCHNQLSLWKVGGFDKVAEFHGHTARVLAMAKNPAGDCIVTAGADETLRFWSIFKPLKYSKVSKDSPSGSMNSGHR